MHAGAKRHAVSSSRVLARNANLMVKILKRDQNDPRASHEVSSELPIRVVRGSVLSCKFILKLPAKFCSDLKCSISAGRRNDAECGWGGEINARVVENRRIENVIKLAAELQLHIFKKTEGLKQDHA